MQVFDLTADTLPVMGFFGALRRRFFPNNDERGPRECAYGNVPGAWENCTVIVPSGQGVAFGRRVFCTDEHAALDQAEQIM